jgi:DNA-directed RNA polymerase II subunit RPB1
MTVSANEEKAESNISRMLQRVAQGEAIRVHNAPKKEDNRGKNKPAFDTLPSCTVEGSCISLMSYQDLKELAVCSCNVPELSGVGTPNDPRMGTLERDELCSTCKLKPLDCTGHLGMIELHRWFLNPKFAETAVRILMSVCNCCGSLLVSKRSLKKMGVTDTNIKQRISKISNITSRITRCLKNPIDSNGIHRPCTPNPKYTPSKTKDTYIVMCEYTDPHTKEKIQTEKTIEDIYDLFSRIDLESLEALGFTGKTNPTSFIMKAFPVIPPRAIPPVYRDGKISYDYVTTAYVDIIRHNNIVLEMINDPDCNEAKLRKIVRNLYFYISHTIDNTDAKYTRSRDEPIQSLIERLGKKSGIIRRLAMGKRGDFGGRSVLNPYNTLEFGYVAFPKCMARCHTVPLKVNDFNHAKVMKMYHNDSIVNLIINSGPKKGCRFSITNKTRDYYTPQVGDTVERVGMNGDETMFNRQPTLDKYSIMGYKAFYVEDPEYLCFGLHSTYNTPHNSDYDGDEGNKLSIQTISGRSEIRHVASVSNCMMNTKSNKPTIGLVYNSITSGYLLTKDDNIIPGKYWDECFNKCINRNHEKEFYKRLEYHNIEPTSGKALFSSILPYDFYYSKSGVVIKNGVIIAGQLTVNQLGTVDGSIIHHIWKNYGMKRTDQFITEGQFILDWYIEYHGFSVGIGSVIPNSQDKVDQIIKSTINASNSKISILGDITPNMTKIQKSIHESHIIGYLNNVSRIGGKISKETIDPYSSINVMCRSGAKGKESNTAQIIGCLGQQYVLGERTKLSITKNTRHLPYYEPNSKEISSRGFVVNSFKGGIDPGEFFAHMSASRVGLMDTALKTGEIGHMHHRIVKALEDVTIKYNGSVSNTNDALFSFSYEGGFNTSEIMRTHSDSTGEVLSFINVKAVSKGLDSQTEYERSKLMIPLPVCEEMIPLPVARPDLNFMET